MTRFALTLLALPALAAAAGPCTSATAACRENIAVGARHAAFYRSFAVGAGTHANVERVYIMVHGTNRNADDYYRWALASTIAADKLGQTLVISPHFKARTTQGRGDEVEPNELYWTNEGWKAGEAALNSPDGAPAYSFDVMDRLLEALGNARRFPNLKEIVVAGHSAGGQYVQRYAALGRGETKIKTAVRYVVANPSSYVYPNALRIAPGSACNEKGECTGGFAPYPAGAGCPAYNDYRYGLMKLTGYAAQVDPAVIPGQLAKRKVTYLVGELDTRTDDPSLDKTCQARAQGANRRERGANFWNYIKSQFGAAHQFGIAAGCGHAAVCVFAGSAGVKTVFGAP